MQKLVVWGRYFRSIGGGLWSALFIHPASRFIAALGLTLVLTFGGLREKDQDFGYGWLPGWYQDAYIFIAATLSAQPLIASISDAVTKRRLKIAIRDGLDEGLGRLVERIRDVARITTGAGWGNTEARNFERTALEALQHLFVLTGVPDPRICFYRISNTDTTEADQTDNPVVQELTYVYHHPRQRPTQKFNRHSENAEGMFEALDNGQPSRVESRPNFDPLKHRWRSALRVPIQHEQTRWGILTLDSPKKGATADGYQEILGFGAALIGLARLCEDSKSAPSDEQLNAVLGDFKH